MEYDVCIVGGGPSGVITAITIAKEGYSVVLIDRKEIDKIGDKNCGDAIDATHIEHISDVLKNAAPSIEKGEARELLDRITIASGGLNSKITATQSSGYMVDRLVYGQRLLKTAIELGVTVLDRSSVIDIIIEDNFIRGVIYSHRDRGKQEIRAKITVDATGYTAKIRNLIPKSMRNDIDLTLPDKYGIATYREIIEIDSPHEFQREIVWIYHNEVPPPGYLWIFSEGERKLNIGITWARNIPYPKNKSLKQLYHEFLDPYFHPSEYKILYHGGGNIPMRPVFDSMVFNGVILVGDAAAMVDPTTFEGHGPALESGRHAGLVAIDALKKNSFTIDDLWQYNVNIMKYPGGVFAQSFIVSRMLQKLGVSNLSFLINRAIISEEDLITTFKNPDAEFSVWVKIKKLFQAFPRWGLMLSLKKSLDLIDEVKKIYDEYPESRGDINKWIERRNNIFDI